MKGDVHMTNIEGYEKLCAERELMSELDKGERSAIEHGWIDLSEIEKEFANDLREEFN